MQKISDISFEILTFEGQHKNPDMWNCLIDIHGEDDGSLTIDQIADTEENEGADITWPECEGGTDNNLISQSNYDGFMFQTSLN